LNPRGYVLFARLVVEELRSNVPGLAPVLLAQPRSTQLAPGTDPFDATVAADGTGTFTNLQEAINAAPDNSSGAFRIRLKPGVYEGQFLIPKTKPYIQLVGSSQTNSILTYSLNVTETNSRTIPAFRGTGMIVLGDNFSAENLTFQNTSGDHGQALALRVDADRALFKHCRLLGWQDTLMLNNGRDYLTNCYIEGRVDFIYGSATAVFDHCEIHSKNGGHITAASTPQNQTFGFVFTDCKLTGDPLPWIDAKGVPANAKPAPKADLGRPWRPYACVAYLNCWMGDHIKSEGWNNWGKVSNETTARYFEYRSIGPGANPRERCRWSHQFTDQEAAAYTVENILAGLDKWDPTAN
jgi:pectinesterase